MDGLEAAYKQLEVDFQYQVDRRLEWFQAWEEAQARISYLEKALGDVDPTRFYGEAIAKMEWATNAWRDTTIAYEEARHEAVEANRRLIELQLRYDSLFESVQRSGELIGGLLIFIDEQKLIEKLKTIPKKP